MSQPVSIGNRSQLIQQSAWNALKSKTIRKLIGGHYEFLQENDCFDVEAQYEEDEEGNEYPIEIDDKENLLYFLNLLKNADHKINREEIKDYRSALKLELY